MKELTIDFLYSKLGSHFENIEDHRNPINVQIKLVDLLMSGFAMFSLKDRSLLKFINEYRNRASNLKNIYGIDKLPSDTALRETIDKIPSKELQLILGQFSKWFIQESSLNNYKLFGGYFYIPIDGTDYFSSQKVNCKKCLTTNHQNGTVTYCHKGLVATLVHPDNKEVFPLAIEAITKQDGATKNDSELSATYRLLPSIKAALPPLHPAIIGGDALFVCVSFIRQVLKYDWDFLLTIKEGNQPFPFEQFDKLQKTNKVTEVKKVSHSKNRKYLYQYANGLILNQANSDIKVNFLRYQEIDLQTGKILKEFNWITSIEISNKNVKKLVLTGRSRWKIENETFNTLKNQGYQFQHNFGHGQMHLADNFAILMLLAFLVDQIAQRFDKDFKKAWITVNTKIDLWEMVRRYFDMINCQSMKTIYKIIAGEVKIKIEIQDINDS